MANIKVQFTYELKLITYCYFITYLLECQIFSAKKNNMLSFESICVMLLNLDQKLSSINYSKFCL